MSWLFRILMVTASLCVSDLALAEPVGLTMYDDVDGIELYATPEEYGEAANDKRFRFDRIKYPSGDLEVYAYVYRPKVIEKRLPVIVYNRGSYVRQSFAGEMLVMANRFGQAGYVVVAPMYRGSGGAQGHDEMGGRDLEDLFALLPVLKRMEGVDASRLYLFGESRGGMMAYQALRDGFPARAAAVVGAFTDLDALLQAPAMGKVGKQIWPDLDDRRAEIVRRRSAVAWPDKLKVPLLVLHGEEDKSVPVTQSLALAEKLTEAGADFELHVVNNGDHVLSGLHGQREQWVLDWFQKH